MGGLVMCEKTNEDKKFGILVNSKFLGDLRENDTLEDTLKETVYRHNGTSVEKIIEYHPETKMKVKVTTFDYFNDKKVKSVEEFDFDTGLRTRTTSYTLFKSVTEFDSKTGKKVKETTFIYPEEPENNFTLNLIDEDCERIKQKFNDAISDIKSYKFEPSYNQKACQYCPYITFCDMEII